MDTGGPFHQNFNSILRRDHQKNFLWALRLWVGRRKEPILGYVPKNDEKKNSVHKGLREWIKMSGNWHVNRSLVTRITRLQNMHKWHVIEILQVINENIINGIGLCYFLHTFVYLKYLHMNKYSYVHIHLDKFLLFRIRNPFQSLAPSFWVMKIMHYIG